MGHGDDTSRAVLGEAHWQTIETRRKTISVVKHGNAYSDLNTLAQTCCPVFFLSKPGCCLELTGEVISEAYSRPFYFESSDTGVENQLKLQDEVDNVVDVGDSIVTVVQANHFPSMSSFSHGNTCSGSDVSYVR